ncbi:armadillo-type protein [Powellomyces hirtus]|nr:armadillo-type protein [Powellomyces hirtus]
MSSSADFDPFGTQAHAAPSAALPSAPESFTLDEEKITAADTTEKKEIYLLQWLSNLERDLNKADLSTIKPSQLSLEKLLLKYLTTSVPKPSRPLRQLISRCLVILYTNGDSRTLFDTLAAVQVIVSNKKVEDASIRLSAIHCVGVLTEAHGGKLLSLFPETVTQLMKHFKNAKESDLALRYECLVALERSLKGAGKGAIDTMTKDLVKLAKVGITDKLPLIRAASVELYRAIYDYTSYPPPEKIEEYDLLLGAVAKAMEGGTYALRRSVASFASALLALSQQASQKRDKGKKATKPGTDADAVAVPEKNILEVEEVLAVLSTFLTKATSREVRVGALESYATALRRFGPKFVEINYPAIVKSILDLSTHPKLVTTQAEAAFMRESCGFLLREAVGKMLSETAQINAVKELGNGWLRKWPAVMGTDVAPPDHALVCVLNELAALLIDLGPAIAGEEGAIIDPLMQLIGHPSRAVNLALAWCLRCLSAALPSYMPTLIGKLMALVQKDLNHLHGDKPEFLARFLGYGNVLAGLISAAPTRTLYVSFETMARIFGLCAQLLRTTSTSKDFRAISAQSRVAWTLMGALMCLGPDFVRVHTSQLLLIWKSVFPKPGPKESSNRSELEWEYLLMSREAALAALHSFMVHNPKELATSDVAKRITVCLNNTLSFISALPAVYSTGPPPPPGTSNPENRFYQMENFLRKRLFMCYKVLAPPSTYELSYSQLLRATLDVFAPETDKNHDRFMALVGSGGLQDKAAQAAAQQMSFATSLLQGSVVHVADELGAEDRGIARLLNKDSDVQMLENLLELQTPGTMENDPHCLYLQNVTQHGSQNMNPTTTSQHTYELAYTRPAPSPIPIATIDAAVELFALLLPLQNAAVQESMLEQLITQAKNQNLGTKLPPSAKKRSIQLNIISAIIGALKYVMVKKGNLASGKVAVAIRDLVEEFLTANDPVFRTLASEALGRLARIVGTATFVNPLISNLVDQVVKNRDPDVRAGSALALGYILSYVGGMAAASQLKTVVGILHSLASDPHPLVHTWALHSLWLTIESAGLMYGPFVNSTLSVTVKLLMSETHELSTPAANEQARNGNVEVYPAIGRILYALVGVIGPELSMSTKTRELCFTLYEQLKAEDDPFVVVEAIRCIQHFILFAPKHVDIFTLIPFLQMQLAGNTLTSQGYLTRKAAVTCMYQLAQRSPGLVLEAAGNNQLEEQLFALLDMETDPTIRDEIRDILVNLLKHVAPDRPSRWLTLCKSILSKTGGSVGEAPAADDLQDAATAGLGGHDDDDDDGFGGGEDAPAGGEAVKPATGASMQSATAANLSSGISAKLVLLLLKPRWRTQVFALICLRHILTVISETGAEEHFDLAFAKAAMERESVTSQPQKRPDYLVFKLADLIRMAFSAATANVNDLRLEGLRLLQDILEKFANAPDPDFDDHALLEQYQAQIGAALTPCFAADSAPDVLSLACHVSAVYIGSGINKEVATMSRIVRLLTALMERYKDSEPEPNSEGSAALPPPTPKSPHADVLIRISTLTAWAHLHTASATHSYLCPVTRPNLPALATLWMQLLADYARVKLDPDVLNAAASEPGVRATMGSYLEATRNVVLPFYQTSWPTILQALTSVEESQPGALIASLERHGRSGSPTSQTTPASSSATKSFYILYGLCVEGLAVIGPKSPTDSPTDLQDACLSSLGRLIASGNKIHGGADLDEPVFLETVTLLSKLVQTEDVPVQSMVLGIVRQVVVERAGQYLCDDAGSESLGTRWNSGGSSLDMLTSDEPTSPSDDTSSPIASHHARKARKVLKVLVDIFVAHVPGISSRPTAAVTANRPLIPAVTALLVSALDTLIGLVTLPELLKSGADEFVPIAVLILLGIFRCDKFQDEVAVRAVLCSKALGEKVAAAFPSSEVEQDESGSGESSSPQVTLRRTFTAAVATLMDIFDSEIWALSSQTEGAAADAPESGNSGGGGNPAMLRNALLASVLLTTICPPHLTHHPGNQDRVARAFGRCLVHAHPELPLIAFQTARTAILSPPVSTSSPAEAMSTTYIRLFVPLVVAWMAKVHEELSFVASSSNAVNVNLPAVEDAGKLLVVLYGVVPESKKLPTLSILMSSLLPFLSRTTDPATNLPTFVSNNHTTLHLFAARTLLHVAGAHPHLFREVLASLDSQQKDALQNGLRTIAEVAEVAKRGVVKEVGRIGGNAGGMAAGMGAQPKIELRSFAQF